MLSNLSFWELQIIRAKEAHETSVSKTEYELLMELIRSNKLKRVDKRLQVIRLRLEGMKQQEIANKLGFTRQWVNRLLRDYREMGLEEYARHKYGGNNRAMSIEEEEEILTKFESESQEGKLVVANTIKKALDEKRGKDTGRGYVYMLLKRHKARKVMPRPAHLKKASDEVVETSSLRYLKVQKTHLQQELTFDTGN
jgi:transposase